MADSSLQCSLRERRASAGLSQGELAQHVGVSRQAIIAIEAGRQVPSTAVSLSLARALRCTVEDLFRVSPAPRLRASFAGTPGAARTGRVALGLVDGAWAAHSLDTGDRPGDGLLVAASPQSSTVEVDPLSDRRELERNVLVAGCAPLLGVLAGRLERRHADARATWIATNSTRAIELLRKKLVHVAGLHLVTTETPGGHSAIVQRHFDNETMTIVNLARWQQGLMVRRGNPLGIRSVSDLLRRDVRVVHRDPGAGARKLLERLLGEKGVDVHELAAGPLASGHEEVARWVRLGFADAGVGAEAAALSEDLAFVPLAEERFDLVVPESRLGSRPVARLFELLESPTFRADAGRLAGYDLAGAGQAATVLAS